MRIGVPREIKDGERRVGVTPAGARALAADGHAVLVERGAGGNVGFDDAQYHAAGAQLTDAGAVWSCELVVKVKEVLSPEYPLLSAGTTVFGFAQINRDRVLLEALRKARVAVIGYETVRDAKGRVPLLAPMSRIAGRLAPLAGADALSTARGGSGVLLTGVDDIPGAIVVVLGAGNVGGEAARVAARLGARVRVFSRGATRRDALAASIAVEGLAMEAHGMEDRQRLEDTIADADLVVGGVLEPGTLSPKLVTRAMLRAMRPGSALVDVGIDQGGIAETSRPTSHSEPTYVEEGVVHYCVPNMPSACARTASLALEQAVLPFIKDILHNAFSPELQTGLQVRAGKVVHPQLARDTKRAYSPA